MNMKWIMNQAARSQDLARADVSFLHTDQTRKVRRFHQSFPEYQRTPLARLDSLAHKLSVDSILVKDESWRFGLNAFKVLGGSYAIARYLADQLNLDLSQLSFELLRSKEYRDRLGDITFVTATDGNHGRGIAWAARQLGQKAVVFMPKGSMEIRLANIRAEGAEASITEFNYDDAVRHAEQYAREYGGVLIQDSAWPGYETIPSWIMQGYSTLIDEALEQMEENGQGRPSHVFLQAGVGAFAGSILGYLAARYGEDRPVTVIVEPDEADCYYRSMVIGDGQPHPVTGDMPTIMAGLACGEPGSIPWGIIRDHADCFLSVSDSVAELGMRTLAHPLPGDTKVISGESGAPGLGALSLILEDPAYKPLKSALQLDETSRVLVISTEGDTDPVNYQRIVSY